MKLFLRKNVVFMLPIVFFFMTGIILPTTPRASDSLLFSYNKKLKRLSSIDDRKIVFIGGSNMSFGLNSKTIRNSLKIEPVNLGLHAKLGIKFVLESSKEYIDSGDVVILAFEYHQFYRSLSRGSEELLRMGLDVDRRYFEFFNWSQFYNCLEYLPNYTLSKFSVKEYMNITKSKYYSVGSFNDYGDAIAHWKDENKEFEPYAKIEGDINIKVMDYLKIYVHEMLENGVEVIFTFPVYQRSSFNYSLIAIEDVERYLRNYSFRVMGHPERYSYPDSFFFNTPYHMNGNGVRLRTKNLIEDLKVELKI